VRLFLSFFVLSLSARFRESNPLSGSRCKEAPENENYVISIPKQVMWQPVRSFLSSLTGDGRQTPQRCICDSELSAAAPNCSVCGATPIFYAPPSSFLVKYNLGRIGTSTLYLFCLTLTFATSDPPAKLPVESEETKNITVLLDQLQALLPDHASSTVPSPPQVLRAPTTYLITC